MCLQRPVNVARRKNFLSAEAGFFGDVAKKQIYLRAM